MTELLYLKDHYRKSCESRVIEVLNQKMVIVDQTVFYPQGGGQPSDTGVLRRQNEEFRVLSAKKQGENVALEVNQIGLKPQDLVQQEIDWNRRYALMRMHTSAHILANVISNETGSLITGNQLGETESRMDFNVTEFNAGIAQSFIEKANELIRQKLPVFIEFLERERALARPELVRLKDIMPPNLPVWRIVSIGNVDVQADGGTHVANTSEIGFMELLRTENKGKENRRIYWTLKT